MRGQCPPNTDHALLDARQECIRPRQTRTYGVSMRVSGHMHVHCNPRRLDMIRLEFYGLVTIPKDLVDPY